MCAQPMADAQPMSHPQALDERALLEGLKTQAIGRPTRVFGRVDSTNDTAKALAESGSPHGTVVIASEQGQGRGRQGRPWSSPPGGLWMSVVLRPAQPIREWPRIAFAGAVAVATAVDRLLGVPVRLKWPNDLMLEGRKLGGVLLEASSGYLVLGIGLNVNVHLSAFAPDLAPLVTSLKVWVGHPVDLVGLIQEILAQFEEASTVVQTHPQQVMDQWRARSMTLGRRIRVIGPAESFEGMAEALDDDGVLVVRTDAGVRRVVAGDISVRDAMEARP